MPELPPERLAADKLLVTRQQDRRRPDIVARTRRGLAVGMLGNTGGSGCSGGYTSMSFTSQSASVPVVDTNNFGDTGPATVTSSCSGSVW